MNRFNKHINYICLIVLTLFALSCERDTWLTGMESQGSGDPVNVLLSFEVPQADEVTVTRTMSEQEEHNIRDLYVLIFDAENGSLVSRQYFDENALNVTKVNHYNGDWKSVLDDNPNSTHGTVMAKALEKNCLIFAVANVKGDDSEVGDADQIKAIINNGASSTEKSLTSISNLNEFYQLQAHLKDDISLGRDNSHLLMSGVFVPKDRYKPTNYDAYTNKYQQGVAGLVDIGQTYIAAELKDENGNVDLTKAGVIRLRRLASHIKFNISVNGDINGNGTIDDAEKVFIDFKPESWRVLNMPKNSYLMDQGNEKHKITGEDNFSNPEAQKSMIHADGTYQFDFYMYENFKEARDIHDINATTAAGYPLWSEMLTENKEIVTNYYQPEFGNSVTDIDTSSGNSKKLASLYNNDAHAFKYAKRELALKDNDGTYIISADGTTKQFVYVEPNATYVEIKGRLRFNADNFKLTDLIKRGGVDRTTTQAIKDGYADVTYLVHLGYARKMSIKDEIQGTGIESDDYKMADFNSLRNTEYTYNIEIRGVNSIFTQVVTESPDDTDKRESAKLQTGASGFIGMASQDVYNTDAHFNTFNIFLDIDHLDKEKFYFEINTPWTVIKSTDITDAEYNNSNSKHYKFNADFTWIKVRRNYDQTKGDNENFISYVGNNHRSLMPYYKEQKTGVTDADYESSYHFKANPLIDLYQLQKELEVLSNGGLPITIKSGSTVTAYTAKLETESVGGSVVKVLNYYDADNNKAGTLTGLFYTVYLDEYYYNTKPVGASWNVPYWHEFVNTPARYVSFGTRTAGNSATTFDQESSML
nr:hypothetical protein [Bacteroidaceae bacterium]